MQHSTAPFVIIKCVLFSSIISFQDAFVDYVVPKTFFNDTEKAYHASITVCVQLDQAQNPGKQGGGGRGEGGGGRGGEGLEL